MKVMMGILLISAWSWLASAQCLQTTENPVRASQDKKNFLFKSKALAAPTEKIIPCGFLFLSSCSATWTPTADPKKPEPTATLTPGIQTSPAPTDGVK